MLAVSVAWIVRLGVVHLGYSTYLNGAYLNGTVPQPPRLPVHMTSTRHSLACLLCHHSPWDLVSRTAG